MNESNTNKMIKNKDGSYNMFRIIIISLIFIIGISTIGIYINQNIEMPKVDIPNITLSMQTSIPTPEPTLVKISDWQIPVQSHSNLSLQYNESQSPVYWNWSYCNSYINSTNVSYSSDWTYPSDINSTYKVIVAAGGGGEGAYYNTTSYVVGIGGGGSSGAIDGAGIYHASVEPTIVTSTPTPTLETNMTLLISPFLGESNNLLWIMLPIVIIIFMMRILTNKSITMIPILLTISLLGVILFNNWIIVFVSTFICMFMIGFDWLNDNNCYR